jgi:hypothetical protein
VENRNAARLTRGENLSMTTEILSAGSFGLRELSCYREVERVVGFSVDRGSRRAAGELQAALRWGEDQKLIRAVSCTARGPAPSAVCRPVKVPNPAVSTATLGGS